MKTLILTLCLLGTLQLYGQEPTEERSPYDRTIDRIVDKARKFGNYVQAWGQFLGYAKAPENLDEQLTVQVEGGCPDPESGLKGKPATRERDGCELLMNVVYTVPFMNRKDLEGVTSVWPDADRARWQAVSDEGEMQLFADRYGFTLPPERYYPKDRAKVLPMGLVEDEKGNLSMTCLTCHSGYDANGVPKIGITNPKLNLARLSRDMRNYYRKSGRGDHFMFETMDRLFGVGKLPPGTNHAWAAGLYLIETRQPDMSYDPVGAANMYLDKTNTIIPNPIQAASDMFDNDNTPPVPHVPERAAPWIIVDDKPGGYYGLETMAGFYNSKDPDLVKSAKHYGHLMQFFMGGQLTGEQIRALAIDPETGEFGGHMKKILECIKDSINHIRPHRQFAPLTESVGENDETLLSQKITKVDAIINDFKKRYKGQELVEKVREKLGGEKDPQQLFVFDALAGEKIYNENCAFCHGTMTDLRRLPAEKTPVLEDRPLGWEPIPVEEVGTDSWRASDKGLTPEFQKKYSESWLSGYGKKRFQEFVAKNFDDPSVKEVFEQQNIAYTRDNIQKIIPPRGVKGYSAPPLTGITHRRPYMHNGSMANLFHVLLLKRVNGDGDVKFNPSDKQGFVSMKPEDRPQVWGWRDNMATKGITNYKEFFTTPAHDRKMEIEKGKAVKIETTMTMWVARGEEASVMSKIREEVTEAELKLYTGGNLAQKERLELAGKEVVAVEVPIFLWKESGSYTQRGVNNNSSTDPTNYDHIWEMKASEYYGLARKYEQLKGMDSRARDKIMDPIEYRNLAELIETGYDTSFKGNSNAGHPFADELSTLEKIQVLQYLKTL